MLPANKRGLTTQNTAPSVSSGAACAFVAMVARTCVLSADSRRPFTVPNSISLNLSGDLPACRPSALSNEISIVGPSFDIVSQTSHAAIATASKGISQIAESRCDRRVIACGGAGNALEMSIMQRLLVQFPRVGASRQPCQRMSGFQPRDDLDRPQLRIRRQ